MFIQTETTPNPATLKFLPGLVVLAEGTRNFDSKEDAVASPSLNACSKLKVLMAFSWVMILSPLRRLKIANGF